MHLKAGLIRSIGIVRLPASRVAFCQADDSCSQIMHAEKNQCARLHVSEVAANPKAAHAGQQPERVELTLGIIWLSTATPS